MPQPASCNAIARITGASMFGRFRPVIRAANSPASAACEGCVIIQQSLYFCRWDCSTTLQAGTNSVLGAGNEINRLKIISFGVPWTHPDDPPKILQEPPLRAVYS